MSSETTQEMEAGVRLNAAVAEEVMGALWWRSSSSGKRFLYLGRPPYWFEARADGSERVDWTGHNHLPDYSDSIAAAWEVVEALRARGWDIGIEDFRHRTDTADCWRVDLHRDDNEAVEDAFAETVPLAICRAALAAVRNP